MLYQGLHLRGRQAIIDSAAIHIHTWSGCHLQTLSRQELNLNERAHIRAVNCDVAGNTLILAAGRNFITHCLHAYRVSDK